MAPSEDPFVRAFAEGRAAAARGEVPVGAAIVREGLIIAAAGNRTLADRDPTAHAEILAIRAAAAALGSERLGGCDLYATLEPCAMCAGAISFARIRRLYYAAPDPKGGAVDHGPRFFAQPTCHHAPEVYGGIRESEAAEMLRGFFRERRSGPSGAGQVARDVHPIVEDADDVQSPNPHSDEQKHVRTMPTSSCDSTTAQASPDAIVPAIARRSGTVPQSVDSVYKQRLIGGGVS